MSSKDVKTELSALREAELLEYIKKTVAQLNELGDRLEEYVAEIETPQVGFDLNLPDAPFNPGEARVLESPKVPGNDDQ
jgi:hypothetical protein